MDDPDGKKVIREYKDIKTIGDARKFAKKYYGFKLDFAPCFRKQADYDAKALNALPITVHPFWIDDGGWAKEFSDTLREFQADAEYNVEFNEWADQEMMTHGKDISFKDWAEDEGMKHGNVPITEWAQHEEESHDARYGAESTNDLMDLKVGQEIKINGLMREGEIPSQTKLRHVREWDGEEYFPEYYEGYVDVPIADDGSISTDSHNALYYAVKYWMRPELGDKTDGYFFQFKARPMDEADGTWKGKPAYYPNKVRWGQLRWDKDQDRFFIDGLSDELSADGGYIHEDGDTLEARAYNERGIYSITPLEKKSAEEEEIWDDEDYYNIEGEDYWDRIEGMYEDFCEDWEDNPDNDGQDCPSMDEWVETYGNFDAEDLNWGGDPKGQLATALRKARIKAKEPKKPLKIEKLGAETSGIEKRKIGETVAWNNSIIGMDGKWRDGVYDLYEIGNQIGYVVVHQDIHNSENEWEENSVLLGSKGTDIAEISFAGLNIYTGSDGSFPIVGIYERIEDYYSRTQNKPHPTKHMTMDEKFSHDDYEKMQYLEDKWERGFIEWAQTVYDFDGDGDLHFYTVKDLLQEEHKLLVGARISISNPSKPHLEQRDSKSSVWVMEYPNLTDLTKGQYRSFTVGTNDIFINTENTVDTFFANLQKQYPDGKIEEYDRGWKRMKKFSIKIPTFGTYTWRAIEEKLAYESLTDEELKRKRDLESQKRQKEYAQQRKEKQDALRAKYDAEDVVVTDIHSMKKWKLVGKRSDGTPLWSKATQTGKVAKNARKYTFGDYGAGWYDRVVKGERQHRHKTQPKRTEKELMGEIYENYTKWEYCPECLYEDGEASPQRVREKLATSKRKIKIAEKELGRKVSYGEAIDWARANGLENWRAETFEASGQWEIGEQLEEAQMNADSGWNMPPGVFSIPEPEHWGDYDLRHEYDYEDYLDLELWKEAGLTEPEEYEDFYDRKEEEAKRIAEEKAKEEMERDKEDARSLGYACMYDEYPHEWEVSWTGDGFQCKGCSEWRKTIEDDKNAETFRAEDKKRKKISGLLSDPFDELSLDSGGIKKWLAVGIIGGLTIFGYKKWK